jgi:hypothetical protein
MLKTSIQALNIGAAIEIPVVLLGAVADGPKVYEFLIFLQWNFFTFLRQKNPVF